MALPQDRDATLAPGSQIPSALLNNIQDMIIGARHGDIRKLTPANMGMFSISGATNINADNSVNLEPSQTMFIPLRVVGGDVIVDAELFIVSHSVITGANTFTSQLYRGATAVGAGGVKTAGTAPVRDIVVTGSDIAVVALPATLKDGSFSVQVITGANADATRISHIDYLIRK